MSEDGLRLPALVIIPVLFAHPSFPQATPSFEVASVRPHSVDDKTPSGTSGGPGMRDPEHYFGRAMSLHAYLCIAFATSDCRRQISGPGWIDSEKYDIVANVPSSAAREQFQEMLQNLLVERFRLLLRHETRILEVYELVIAKNGPKLKESVEAPSPDPAPKVERDANGLVERDANGFPKLPPGLPILISSFGPGWVSHWAAQQQTMSMFADRLSAGNLGAGRQVIDKTGLMGKYDFRLVYEMALPGAPAGDDMTAPFLEGALEQQLGLKLVNVKAPFEFVIVDSGDKVPVEN
jgi:uncharacterized protein (TIGR03435 family)